MLRKMSEPGSISHMTTYLTRSSKKTRTQFYTPAYEEWEAKYMPQPETVPAT